MDSPLLPVLDHPSYSQAVRLAHCRQPMTALNALLVTDAGDILLAANPAWSVSDHRRLAHLHGNEFDRLEALHGQLADASRWSASSSVDGDGQVMCREMQRVREDAACHHQLRAAHRHAADRRTAA